MLIDLLTIDGSSGAPSLKPKHGNFPSVRGAGMIVFDGARLELERSLREEKLAGSGDRIVILLGAPAGTRGGTNLMKLHTIT